jgi:protein KRI1
MCKRENSVCQSLRFESDVPSVRRRFHVAMSKKKALFDEEEDEGLEFHVNRTFAEKFDHVKRKQELQKLSSKYGNVESDSDATEEDDDAQLIDESHEAEFFDLLKKLRSRDPELTSSSKKYFDTSAEVAAPAKPFTLKDEFQRTLAERPVKPERVASKDQERKAREEFLAAAATADHAAEFKVRAFVPEKQPLEKKKMEAFGTPADEKEAFLAKFFANDSWRMSGDVPYNWEQEAADEQDEAFYDDAEQWEKEFQEKKYRHEEGEEATRVQAYPRHQEGLLRSEDTRRKDARVRKEERKHDEELRATEELKRLKNLKQDEIKAFRRKISEIAGIGRKKKTATPLDADDDVEDARVAALLSKAALEEDFDPATFDQQMNALFDDDYYQNIDDDELQTMAKHDELADTSDAESEGQGGEDDDILYPTKALERAVASEQPVQDANETVDVDGLKRQLDQKIDEYYKLHHTGTAGGIRTRFKYRDVNPERFGLEMEDILSMDDRALNMIAPLSIYATYNTKAQNTKDRFKAMHRRKNVRLLPAERKSRRYAKDTVVFDPTAIDDTEGTQIARTIRKKITGQDEVEADLQAAQQEQSVKTENISANKRQRPQVNTEERRERKPPRSEKQRREE